MGLRTWATAGSLLALLASSPATAGPVASGTAVEGHDLARILPPPGARISDYENTGYRIRLIGSEVRVEVDAAPLNSTATFELPEDAGGEPVGRLARGLTSGARTQYDAVSRILSWVARNIEYSFDREASQSAESVLERRTGYCTGIARLSVALLGAVDLPAREVAGYVVGGRHGETGGFHRWIEVRLSDVGWVFSDPLRSHHYVPATYLRLDSNLLTPDDGLDGLLLERENRLATVDLYPGGVPGISARRNSRNQVAGAVQVRIDGSSTGLAILAGEKVHRRHALVDGQTTFVGLDPGPYKLRILLPGRGMIERSLNLPDRRPRALQMTMRRPGTIPADLSQGDTE